MTIASRIRCAAMFRRASPIGDRVLGGNPKIKPIFDLIKAAA